MEQINDTGRDARSDIVCLEGNGIRPSHRGDGWSTGGAIHGVVLGIEEHDDKAEDNLFSRILEPTIGKC